MNIFFAAGVVVCVVLVGAMLVLAIRGYRRLRSASRGTTDVADAAQHQPGLLLFFIVSFLLCVTLSTIYFEPRFLSDPLAVPSHDGVLLFKSTAAITGLAFFVTHILLFWFAFRYRQREGRRANYELGSVRLELVWTIVPLIAFVFLFLWGQTLWAKFNDPLTGNDVLELHVMGEQFNWKVRYPGADGIAGRSSFGLISENNPFGVDPADPNSADDFVPVQMHIPKNRYVRLMLNAHDVIHSFYIPNFQLKMDAVPGMVTTLQFKATTSTAEMRERSGRPDFNYEVACAELCGRMHFGMKLILVVDEPEDFDAWYADQRSRALQASLQPHPYTPHP